LPAPINLNEMRTIKEPNYSALRELLSKNCGGQVLNYLREYQHQVGLEADIFDLAYECFWDVYTLKAQIPEVSAKKL